MARADLLLLTVSGAWDAGTRVGELNVSGWRPTVQDAAAAVVRAHATENMEELRGAVSVFVTVICGQGARSTAETRAG